MLTASLCYRAMYSRERVHGGGSGASQCRAARGARVRGATTRTRSWSPSSRCARRTCTSAVRRPSGTSCSGTLGAVARSAIARVQARWLLDGQASTSIGTTLQLDHVSRLIEAEFRRAQILLHNNLLFGAHEEIGLATPWPLEDDLDQEDYGWSCVSDGRNGAALAGMQNCSSRLRRAPTCGVCSFSRAAAGTS